MNPDVINGLVAGYKGMLERFENIRIDSVESMDCTPTVRKSGLSLIKGGDVSAFRIDEVSGQLEIHCRCHAKVVKKEKYDVDFAWDKNGFLRKSCDCDAFSANGKYFFFFQICCF